MRQEEKVRILGAVMDFGNNRWDAIAIVAFQIITGKEI